MRRAASIFLLIPLASLPAAALEIELRPSDHVYLNRIDANPPLTDLVLHGIQLTHRGPEPVVVDWIEVRAVDDEGRRGSRRLVPAESSLGDGALEAGERMAFSAIYLASRFEPTGVEIVASYRQGDRRRELIERLPVVSPDRRRAYAFPLRGTWYMSGIPSALSHHRWSTATEFAVDFFKVDERGEIGRDVLDPESYYGYGAAVRAAEEGVVERVIDGMTQDRAARARRDGESTEAYSRRMARINEEAIKEHGLGAATGNLVVLRHPSGERTAYGHLKAGSLRVAEGDRVERGQTIAEVGDTGDSAAVHLHFQVMEAEAMEAGSMRSIPFRFESLRIRSREYGSWVSPESANPDGPDD